MAASDRRGIVGCGGPRTDGCGRQWWPVRRAWHIDWLPGRERADRPSRRVSGQNKSWGIRSCSCCLALPCKWRNWCCSGGYPRAVPGCSRESKAAVMGCLNTGKLKPLLAGMVDSFSPRQKSGKRREGLECQGKDNLIHSCCCQTTPTPKACVFEKGFFGPGPLDHPLRPPIFLSVGTSRS